LDAGKIFLEMNGTLYSTFHWRFSKQFLESKLGYGTSVWVTWVTCGFLNAATSSVKRVPEIVLQLASIFIEANTISVFYLTIGTLTNLKTIL
jgi:hypothetical protein